MNNTNQNKTRRGPILTIASAIVMFGAACGSTSATPATTVAQTSTTAQTPSTSSSVVSSTTTTAQASTSSSATSPTTVATTTTAPNATVVVPGNTSCSASELPPPGNPFSPVIVAGITAVDPDKGLIIRFDPTTSSGAQFALPNGSGMGTTGLCEKSPDGTVWWAVEDGHWDGWASSRYLIPYVAGTSTCPAGVYNPIGKGTVDSILGDYDGNGSVDALFLAYDGIVQPPNQWTGSTATVQIQFADGGLSTELDITASLGDGGPGLGISQMPTFPQRVDPANTFRSVAVLGSTYAGSATGAGLSHFVGVDGCDPVILTEIPVTPSVGNPQRPYLCDIGGGGRTQLYALDGLNQSFDFLVTEYDFQGSAFVPKPQATAGNASTDPDPTC